jgi:phosphoglycerol transferase MdoB-like AlkP superfamily enzyme
MICLSGLSFIGIRGGLQHKSINVQSAFVQGHNELGVLVLNTPYYFFRTFNNQNITRLRYFKNNEDLKLIINKRRVAPTQGFITKPFNIVLIILESFSLEYMENGYMPFLSDLSKRSMFFNKHLSNGRRSIESLPALLCGLPSLIDEPLSKSKFATNKFNCFPKVLKAKGYTNYFFHAGARGTMGFEAYTLAHGFDKYFSREDYPNPSHDDGTWGIFDGPYLEYVAKNLSQMPTPFLAGIFSLSSHQPYSIPKDMKGKFPKGNLEIHESIGYTDHSLKIFFNRIQNESWFNNTLFILTADHAQKLETKKFKNPIGHYRVPLLLFAPGFDWKDINTNKVTQHSDIPSTVLDFIGNQDFINGMGESVLGKTQGQALNYVDGSFYYRIENDQFFKMTKDGDQQHGTYNWNTGEFSTLKKSDDPVLKAYLQYYINGLLSNDLSLNH